MKLSSLLLLLIIILKKLPPISSVRTSRPSPTVDTPTDEVVHETEETSIVDVPVEDNYYPFVQVRDYSPSSQFDLDDFDLNYLDNTCTTNEKAFQDAFENPSETGSSISVTDATSLIEHSFLLLSNKRRTKF